jgi:tetratricopeptide (TPR) repeat protein
MLRRVFLTLWAIAFAIAASTVSPVPAQADPSYPIPYPREDTLQQDSALRILQKYAAFLKENPTHFEARIVFAQLAFVNWRLEKKDNKRRLQFAKMTLDVGQQMVKIAPDRGEGYHWVGAGLGMAALTRGILNSLQLVPEMKKAFEKSIELSPRYMSGSALVQMARVYTMLPAFPMSIGDKEMAMKYLVKAKDIGPGFTLNNLYLADLYWHYGRKEDALAELDKIAQIKPKDEVEFFLLHTNLEKAKELRRLISSGATRDPFYDVLSDIQPGLVD